MKHIIYIITLCVIGCGGADFIAVDKPNGNSGNSGSGGFSFAGHPNSTGGNVITSSGGNAQGGAQNAPGGSFNGSGGNPLVSSGGAPMADSGGGNGCEPKTCADVAVELKADKACGNVDNGCGHFMDCGNDCAKGEYDPFYAKCGAANTITWQSGAPVFFSNKNLCGVDCTPGTDIAQSNGNVGPCEFSDGVPYKANLPIEVDCKYEGGSVAATPIPYPGCEMQLLGNIFIGSPSVFCCTK